MGVDLKPNHLVGRSVPVKELPNFDAVFLATGAGLPYFMGLPGENLPGVYSANEFLTRVNLMHADQFPVYDTPVKRGSRVVVVGGEMSRWMPPASPVDLGDRIARIPPQGR